MTLEGEPLQALPMELVTFSTWMLDTHLLGASERVKLAWLNIAVLNIAVPLIAGFLALALGHGSRSVSTDQLGLERHRDPAPSSLSGRRIDI
jgi:hypothetical protein